MDYGGALPQALAGGGAGLPCSRLRLESPSSFKTRQRLLTETAPLVFKSGNENQTAFEGTKNMTRLASWTRSTGSLREGGQPQAAVRNRTQTSFDDLVEILVCTMGTTKTEELHAFPGQTPVNKHRHTVTRVDDDEYRRGRVLRALAKYPLCDIYDLACCSPEDFSKISRELGGISHGVTMRLVMEHLQIHAPSSSRASFWIALGTGQGVHERGRQCSIPGVKPDKKKKAPTVPGYHALLGSASSTRSSF